MAGRTAAAQGFATFSNLEMQHSPKIFCIFLQKVLAKNSLVIGACCLIRCISLYHLIHSGSYLTVEGYCSKQEVSAFKKTQQIHLIGTDDREYQFTTDKSVKLLQGHYYRMYFRKSPYNEEESMGISDNLLGFEELSSGSPSKD